MKKFGLYLIFALAFTFLLSGCVVRSYPVTRDRVDQNLSTGNKGYLKGSPAPSNTERKKTRTTQIVEIELFSPIRIDTSSKSKPVIEESMTIEEIDSEGNRGYMTNSYSPDVIGAKESSVSIEEYKVQKNDTLQKISQKYYGTTKKWMKIYEANKDRLNAPNKIYPGQVLNIPVEGMKETSENLK